MSEDADDERRSFQARRLPRLFELQVSALPAGGSRAYDDPEWRDAIVVVVRGMLELVSANGIRHRFMSGDVLALSKLRLRELHNPGQEPTVLIAVSRRQH